MNKLQQFNIMSFEYDRLANASFNLSITPYEAYQNGELITLADNECLRQIRKITNHSFEANRLKQLLRDKKICQKRENSKENREKLRFLNGEIERQLAIPYFVMVHSPNKGDYNKLCKDCFSINGNKYKWLMCGAGHQRTDRSIYCTESIYEELVEFLSCGAKELDIILAKHNAYFALSATATHRVSRPRVCVVADKEIEMTKLVDWINEDNTIERCDKKLKFNLWDGMGIISPRMAEIWSQDLGLDYLPSAFCIRNAFIKGMVCVFDFNKFGNEVADNNLITDIYGKKYNHEDIDLILTESQFKLWRHYDSWQDYEKINIDYGWSWGVSKIAPKQDSDYIRSNYQFLQVLDLSDKDIVDICQPTINWFNDISGEDISKMELYLLGKVANKNNAVTAWGNIQDNFVKSLITENSLCEDTYIRNRIVNSLNKRIRESYIGKLIFDGNFQFMIADPYGLCEHAFGLKVKGLLNEHEHFSKYWNKKCVDEVVAMRSPLTWRSEINKLNFQNTDKQNEWYKYLYSGIIYNVWGCDCMIHADSDFDGDLVCTIHNDTLLKAYERI